jgi:hypothetical protein
VSKRGFVKKLYAMLFASNKMMPAAMMVELIHKVKRIQLLILHLKNNASVENKLVVLYC